MFLITLRVKMIKIRNLTKAFGDAKVLENLSIDLPIGEVIAVLGKNGSGKTTFLRIMANLVTPDSGDISLNSNRISKQDCAIMTNNERAFFWRLSAFENLRYFSLMAGLNQEVAMERIQLFAKRFNILNKLNKKFSLLSSGEKKKIGLIRLLIKKQSIFLFDEVTAALDGESKSMLIDILKDEKKCNHTPKTIFWATHNLDELNEFCSYYFCLSNTLVKHSGKITDKSVNYLEKFLNDKNV